MKDFYTLLPLVAGLFGAVLGSFLNVVIYRLPDEELTVFRPQRSFCPKCERQLRWFENIPVVSWLIQGGRCRGCKAAIPSRYVVVEVLTSLLFGYFTVLLIDRQVFDWQTWIVLASGLYLTATCIVVTYIDIDHKIIPDEITWPGMALGVLLSVVAPSLHQDSWLFYRLAGDATWNPHVAAAVSSLAGMVTGIGVVLGVGWLGGIVFRKEAMGLGDVKYLGMMGAFLGVDGILLVFFLGCITGAVGGLIHRAVTGERYIAFGPYLSLGVLLVLFYRNQIVEFFLHTWPETVRGVMGLE